MNLIGLLFLFLARDYCLGGADQYIAALQSPFLLKPDAKLCQHHAYSFVRSMKKEA